MTHAPGDEAAILVLAHLMAGEVVLEVARINIGAGGLPTCGRCSASSANDFRSLADVAIDIESAATPDVAEFGVVQLVGADAFGHPALPQIIGIARNAGVRRIGVQTAGGLLGVGGNAQGALHAGVRQFEIHYLPGDETVPMPGIPGALDGIAELVAVAALAETRVAISAVLVACRHTIQLLSAAVGKLAAAGVGAVHIEVDKSAGIGAAATTSILAACDTGVVNAVWVDVTGFTLPVSHSMHAAQGDLA